MRKATRDAIDPASRALLERLIALAVDGLPHMYLRESDEYVFTRAGSRGTDGTWSVEDRGVSRRYAAIVALGAHYLPAAEQWDALGGRNSYELCGSLIDKIHELTDPGEVALVLWAAAEHGHADTPKALERYREVFTGRHPLPVVDLSWALSGLVAARRSHEVDVDIARARDALLATRRPHIPLFPHATGPGQVSWYRDHVACFADQVYPIQALSRLYDSTGDVDALAAARGCADRICELQGPGGQWWWHYDARTGGLVEPYPVYSVHQHAMAPMALADLVEAGGDTDGRYTAATLKGLRWMTDVTELHGTPQPEPLILDDLALTWRKVYRGDPKKLVRGANALTSRVAPGRRLGPLERLYRPGAVDYECRPYELGWLLYAWLARP